jgi:hypothetical protein
MRRKLKNLKHKSGHSENGSPRTLIDLTVYYEHRSNVNVSTGTGGALSPHWDPQYSGWSNASRPRDSAIFLRSVIPEPKP